MKPEKLIDAADTLKWLSERLLDFTDDNDAKILALHCQAAILACVELARHRLNGDTVLDAIDATIRGELQTSAPMPVLQIIASKYLH